MDIIRTYRHRPARRARIFAVGGVTAGFLLSAAVAHAQFSVDQIEDISFGEVIVGMVAGSIKVPLSGVASVAGPIVHLGGERAATFRLRGPVGAAFSISLPVTVGVINGNASMEIRDFEADVGTGITQGDNNPLQITVGATIFINGDQPSGDYFGTFMITVEQQ